jgi:hypothetical protein
MTGLTSRLYALPDIQNECYLLANCPYEVDTFRFPLTPQDSWTSWVLTTQTEWTKPYSVVLEEGLAHL